MRPQEPDHFFVFLHLCGYKVAATPVEVIVGEAIYQGAQQLGDGLVVRQWPWSYHRLLSGSPKGKLTSFIHEYLNQRTAIVVGGHALTLHKV